MVQNTMTIKIQIKTKDETFIAETTMHKEIIK